MATAKNSIRSGSALRNAELSKWSGSIPVGYSVTLTGAATLTELTKEMEYLHNAGQTQFEVVRTNAMVGHPTIGDPLVKHEKAARFFVPDSATDGFNIRISGLAVNFSGDADWGLPWVAGLKHVFSFWARGTRNLNVILKIVMRDAAGSANVSYLNAAPGHSSGTITPPIWSSTAAGLSIAMQPIWTRYSVEFFPILVDLSGTLEAGLPSTDSLVFAFEGGGIGGTHFNTITDLGGFEYEIRSGTYHQEA